MKVLILDNYDSFTFNLYQYVGDILTKQKTAFVLDVIKNDEVAFEQIEKSNYDRIIISPGPGNPGDAKSFGVCSQVITKLGHKIPILGVCLGMQGIAYCFGGKIVKAKKPMHGKRSLVTHDGKEVFKNLPEKLEVMRYHSLIVERATLPKDFFITALAQDTKEIMGLRHKTYPLEGIQFHPESFATQAGKTLLSNFLLT